MEISRATNYPKSQSIFAPLLFLQVLKELIEITNLCHYYVTSIILRYANYTVADLVLTAQEFEEPACLCSITSFLVLKPLSVCRRDIKPYRKDWLLSQVGSFSGEMLQ